MGKTINDIKAHKGQAEALVCLTAYTKPMAQAIAPYVDFILVGDSVGMVLYGLDSTVGVDLEMMIRHGQAVMRGCNDVPVIIDMPAGSYEDSTQQALKNAQRLVQETGCDAVKLEGGTEMAAQITAITQAGIPVMGHIGLMPQSALKDGGFKVKGKTPDQISSLLSDARAVETAGAFAFVIEGTVDTVSALITREVKIPTIGIGASASCDGQVLVSEDMLGLLYGHTPKFAKKYAQLAGDIESAAEGFAREVRSRAFPSDAYLYHAPTPPPLEQKKVS